MVTKYLCNYEKSIVPGKLEFVKEKFINHGLIDKIATRKGWMLPVQFNSGLGHFYKGPLMVFAKEKNQTWQSLFDLNLIYARDCNRTQKSNMFFFF